MVEVAAFRRGCAPALALLLKGLTFSVGEGEYDTVHEAAWAGSTENLRILFDYGMADPKSVSNPHTGWPDNVTLLYWAVFMTGLGGRDGAAMTRMLLEHGADPEVRLKGNGERGNTVLQEATLGFRDGREGILEALLDYAYYDIFTAASLNDVGRIKELAVIEDVAHLRGEAELTPLHWAARANALDSARYLLDRGADVNAESVTQRVPLHLAADGNHADMVWLLVEHGADLNAQDTKGRTPLHRAAYLGSIDVAEILIVLGADRRVQNRSGKRPLDVARLACKHLKSLEGT